MDVIAQWVRTEWTKQSRGGPEAARRNAAPAAFPLRSVHPPLTHTVVMAERNGFKPEESLDYALPNKDEVLLAEADGRLRVELLADRGGAPERKRLASVRLSPGEWVRWQINYRFGGGDFWRYRLDTLNLAYGDVKPDVFTGSPTHHRDDRAHLR